MGIRSFLGKRKKSDSLMMIPGNESPLRSPSLFLLDSTKRVQEIEVVFKKFDINGDGKIDWSELGSIMGNLGYSATEEELKRMVEEVDSDGDGFIDLNEFIELNTTDDVSHLEDVKTAFSILDANGDGSISPQELQKVLRSLGGNSSSLEDCKRMINAVDCDEDGLISFEEFKTMMIRGSASSDFLQRNNN